MTVFDRIHRHCEHPGQHFSWCNYRTLTRNQLPQDVRHWLLTEGSLTNELVRLSDGHFSVQVLRQAWARPTLEEAQALGQAPGQVALIREVLLQGQGQAWVYARSILPRKTLQGRLRFLRKLKNSSLGALLFRDPSLSRAPFQICALAPASLAATTGLSALRAPSSPALWGRRSVFHLYGKPLLVAEVFLPDLLPHLTRQPR